MTPKARKTFWLKFYEICTPVSKKSCIRPCIELETWLIELDIWHEIFIGPETGLWYEMWRWIRNYLDLKQGIGSETRQWAWNLTFQVFWNWTWILSQDTEINRSAWWLLSGHEGLRSSLPLDQYSNNINSTKSWKHVYVCRVVSVMNLVLKISALRETHICMSLKITTLICQDYYQNNTDLLETCHRPFLRQSVAENGTNIPLSSLTHVWPGNQPHGNGRNMSAVRVVTKTKLTFRITCWRNTQSIPLKPG